jgi:hypothetical protein
MRFRFSIASMMAAILIIALSFAALRFNSVFYGGIILLTPLVMLCSPIFMSLAESGPSRLAWIGCAVFGWPCFMLGFGPVANERLGPPTTALWTLGFAAMGAILGYSHAVRCNRAAGTEEAVTSEP